MNRNTLIRVLGYLIVLLLVLQGACSFSLAYSFASMFRGAQNVRVSDPSQRSFGGTSLPDVCGSAQEWHFA